MTAKSDQRVEGEGAVKTVTRALSKPRYGEQQSDDDQGNGRDPGVGQEELLEEPEKRQQ